jgi:N-acetylneuraminic acid mutarotase
LIKTLLQQKQLNIIRGTAISKNAALLIVIFFLTSLFMIVAKPASAATPAENSWESKTPMPEGKSGFGLAVVNGKIYAIGGIVRNYVDNWPGGISGTLKVVNTNYEYDPAIDKWIIHPSMPTARYGFAAVAYNDSIVCIGGAYYSWNNPVLTAAVEVFNLSTNNWEIKTSLPTKRNDIITIVYQNSIYCITEEANEAYNIMSDTWQTKAPVPFNGSIITANVVNGKLYVTSDSQMYVYNPATDSWLAEAPLQTLNYGTISAVVDKRIYVISTNSTQIYDTETDTVSVGAPSDNVDGAAIATIGEMAPERIYILGETLQVYDPETDTWAINAKNPPTRVQIGFATVNDRIYAIGGNTWVISPGPFPTTLNISVKQYASNEEYTPYGYGTTPPKISVISPENQNYNASSISLTFTVNRPVVWMGYSLDGRENVTITDNMTLSGLSNGLHKITVYVRDEFENTGASEIVSFSVEDPLTTALVIAFAILVVAVVCVGLLVYFKKRKH